MIGFKVLRGDGSPDHGGNGKWHLPKGKRPGVWMPEIADIKPCERGYHFCRHEYDLIQWFGPVIWRVEVRGNIIECGDKAVASQARLIAPTLWSNKTARLFAADCAERVLLMIPSPQREICAQTIAVARSFAHGTSTSRDLAAAGDAAKDATWAASRAATWATWAASAGAAAGAAATAAAWDAAWDAAKDATWAASWAATWAASAGAAAGAAAKAAAWEWQAARLKQYLNGEIK